MVRTNYDLKLNLLHEDLLHMGEMVENQIKSCIVALQNKDRVIAKKVIDGDDSIDELEKKIEEDCVRLLAMEQPLATDLRKIFISIKIITDLERMADHAVDIAKIARDISEEEYMKELIHIPKMAQIVEVMVRGSVDAYVSESIEKAKEICEMDDKVDEYYDDIMDELLIIMEKKSDTIYQGTKFMFVVRLLERIADHATNICERVVYLTTGEQSKLN